MKEINNKNSLLIILFIFSSAVNFFLSNKGVSVIDTFLHYDSASRILEGNIPIRDYWIVHGLTIDYIQALLFYFFGVNWISYILHSSIFNGIITISTFLFFLHNGLKKEYSFLLSLSFGALAYPVSGTPFLDHHATFFCLLGFYFLSFGINKKDKYLFFVPIFLGLGFFSKQVPSVYFTFFLIIIFLFYILITKKFKLLKYPFYGSIFFLIFIYLFFTIQNIEINLLLSQFFYYPISIGENRYSTLYINFNKIFTNYKFILLPILISLFLARNLLKNLLINKVLFNFLAITLFNLICIYHQLLTNNQNYIFFLIPLNLSFLILFLEKKIKNKNKIKNLIIITFIFCLFTTGKYYQRFNIDKKFHDLQNTSLQNSISAEKKLHISLKPLKWKTRHFDDPNEEFSIIHEVIKEIEKNKKNLILMTNYNFISSITKKRIYTISRTYDDISFPNKKNFYFKKYVDFFYNQVRLKNISHIYLFFTDFKDQSIEFNRYVLEYFDEKCLEKNKINNYLIKINIESCNL